jgi:hypothetical protein
VVGCKTDTTDNWVRPRQWPCIEAAASPASQEIPRSSSVMQAAAAMLM